MDCLLLYPWIGSTVYRWLLPAHTHCWLSQLLSAEKAVRHKREQGGAGRPQVLLTVLCAWPDGGLA